MKTETTRLYQYTTTSIANRHGFHTSAVGIFPLGLPARCTRATLPARATDTTNPSPPKPPTTAITSEPTTRGSHTDTIITGGALGWTPQSRAEEEDQSHEEATQTNGRQSIERCHSNQQMQRMREAEDGARAVSILRSEYVLTKKVICWRNWDAELTR